MINTTGVFRALVYTHTVDQHRTVNADYYIDVRKQLMKDHIPRKGLELVGWWRLYHDNARPHVAGKVFQFLARKNIETVPHSAHSPDLVSNDFFLHPQAKKELKGRRFPTWQAAVKALEAILKRMSEKGFKNVIQEWWQRWEKCVELVVVGGGNYIWLFYTSPGPRDRIRVLLPSSA